MNRERDDRSEMTTEDFYDKIAPFYDIIYPDWDASIAMWVSGKSSQVLRDSNH